MPRPAIPNWVISLVWLMFSTIIYNEIIIIYNSLKELLSDNGRILTRRVIKVYITFLATKHHFTISYYLKMNKIVENFNNLLDNILIKIFINQPIIL
jgi:hypothetical protein